MFFHLKYIRIKPNVDTGHSKIFCLSIVLSLLSKMFFEYKITMTLMYISLYMIVLPSICSTAGVVGPYMWVKSTRTFMATMKTQGAGDTDKCKYRYGGCFKF